MLRVLAVLLACSATQTNAQAWGDAAGCQRAAGQTVSTDNLFILWPDRIERHESICQISQIDGDINTRAVITATCSGEGETWATAYGITPVGDFFAIWPVEATEYTVELRPCE